ncbi:hypothetical protein ACIRP0_13465 [Streptomyces sp. NPDC101733]|uniref:hypothetical protein n=1 Tax=unclassified Streptomyces TaxID=2593676 RepID=UPI0037FBB15F
MAVVASFASLWFSWQGVKAQQTQTQKLDQEVIMAVVSKIGWWYKLDPDGNAELLDIENRSLSVVYDVTLDLVDTGGKIVRTSKAGDITACTRAELNVKGVSEVGQPYLHVRITLTDHRGSHWVLTDQREIKRVPEFGKEVEEERASVSGLTKGRFGTVDVNGCG